MQLLETFSFNTYKKSIGVYFGYSISKLEYMYDKDIDGLYTTGFSNTDVYSDTNFVRIPRNYETD